MNAATHRAQEAKAIKRARAAAKRTGETRYVVWDNVTYDMERYVVATDEDLQTFYAGIRDERIVYCTDDD